MLTRGIFKGCKKLTSFIKPYIYMFENYYNMIKILQLQLTKETVCIQNLLKKQF